MRHVIVFSYIFTILIGVSALTIQWLAGKGDKEKTFAMMRPFIAVLLVMNVYDFVIYYYSNIMDEPVNNLMLSIGDAIIAVLVLLWIKVENYINREEGRNVIVNVTEKYVIAYMIIWLIAVIFFTEQSWIRLIIDIPLLILLVFGSAASVCRSLEKKETAKLIGYKIIISVFMTVNYAAYFLNESGVFGFATSDILDLTIFFWLVINVANMVLLYRRDFRSSYMTEAPVPLNLADALEAVRMKYELTNREIEILEEVYSGKTNTQIADELFISESTVKAHVYNLFRKLGVKSRVEAVCIVREEKEGRGTKPSEKK